MLITAKGVNPTSDESEVTTKPVMDSNSKRSQDTDIPSTQDQHVNIAIMSHN